jgi:flagellar motility protein MotE (MotC chaperone)
MRTVIILGVMAILLFGLAAGTSIFLTSYLQDKDRGARGEHSEIEGTGHEKELPPPLTRGGDAPRTRPGANTETEQLVQEWAKLHEREESVGKQEQQLSSRRRSLDIIKDDIKGEREEIEKLRKELNEQAEGTREDLGAAEKRVKDLEQKTEEEQKLLKDAKKGVYEVDNVRSGGAKRVSAIADTTEPAQAALILENMIESGNSGLMTAAQILAGMKDRRAAQVLSAMQDKSMAADLLEKMVGLKQAAQAGGAKPLGNK